MNALGEQKFYVPPKASSILQIPSEDWIL